MFLLHTMCVLLKSKPGAWNVAHYSATVAHKGAENAWVKDAGVNDNIGSEQV